MQRPRVKKETTLGLYRTLLEWTGQDERGKLSLTAAWLVWMMMKPRKYVVFSAYLMAGLGFLDSPFLAMLLEFYNVKLTHLSLNSL